MMKITNIQNNYNNSRSELHNVKSFKPRFRGHFGVEFLNKNSIDFVKLVQETAFFRQQKSLDFIRQYAEKTLYDGFPLKILDGACSTGEETWTLAMLFSDFKGKVDITGFDMGPKAISTAKRGIFAISNFSNITSKRKRVSDAHRDYYLAFPPKEGYCPQQAKNKALFDKFFMQTSNPNFFDNLLTQIFLYGANRNLNPSVKYYKPRPQAAKMCDFRIGDITKLDDLAKNATVDILLFRNALYHLLTEFSLKPKKRELKGENEALSILQAVFENIHKKLSPNGLFVVGEREDFQHDATEYCYQVLNRTGFVPVFQCGDTFDSVWRKV